LSVAQASSLCRTGHYYYNAISRFVFGYSGLPAPEEPRTVATGSALRWRSPATRNPWNRACFCLPAPAGAEECSRRTLRRVLPSGDLRLPSQRNHVAQRPPCRREPLPSNPFSILTLALQPARSHCRNTVRTAPRERGGAGLTPAGPALQCRRGAEAVAEPGSPLQGPSAPFAAGLPAQDQHRQSEHQRRRGESPPPSARQARIGPTSCVYLFLIDRRDGRQWPPSPLSCLSARPC